MNEYRRQLIAHYESVWLSTAEPKTWARGPVQDFPASFCILEFQPAENRPFWAYATCGMSARADRGAIELHLFSQTPDDAHVELLTAVAHYHLTGVALGLSDTLNFGRPWFARSACDHGLISLPYLDGPDLELFRGTSDSSKARCLWLIPITRIERDFKKEHGIEELERRFEESQFDYLDPQRSSVV